MHRRKDVRANDSGTVRRPTAPTTKMVVGAIGGRVEISERGKPSVKRGGGGVHFGVGFSAIVGDRMPLIPCSAAVCFRSGGHIGPSSDESRMSMDGIDTPLA